MTAVSGPPDATSPDPPEPEAERCIAGFIVARSCRVDVSVRAPLTARSRTPAGDRDPWLRGVMDTGATRTCIREDLAVALRLPVMNDRMIHTAAQALRSRFVLGVVTFVDTRGRSLSTNRLLLSAAIRDEVLLGMDLVKDAVLVVDGQRDAWRLCVQDPSRW
jgi:hypothetical protein